MPAPPADPAAQAWAGVQNTGSETVLEAFLKEFPEGIYTALARARLAELRNRRKLQQRATLPPQDPPADASCSARYRELASALRPAKVEYRMQFRNKLVEGFFVREEGTRWLECNSDAPHGHLNVQRFEEKRRTSQAIELFDASRGMWVSLNTRDRRVYWSNDDKRSWNYIYEITNIK